MTALLPSGLTMRTVRSAPSHDVQAIAAISGDVGDVPESCEARLPVSGRAEAVYVAVGAIGACHVDAAPSIEREIVGFPGLGQQGTWGGCQWPRSTNPCKANTLTR